MTAADKLRNTLVHEMCHAATWILDNDAESHGPTFKKWYVQWLSKYVEPCVVIC